MSMHYFGTCDAGDVYTVVLENTHGLRAEIITLGASLRSLSLPSPDGERRDVVLGYDSAQEYLEGTCYFGATVGRFANRIAKAELPIDGTVYPLIANEGANQLHGGPGGFSRQIWTPLLISDSEAIFRLNSADMDMGFPGNVQAEVSYCLTEDNALVLRYKGQTDRPTAFSLTNHSYFNLLGHESGSVGAHRLMVSSLQYTPTDAELIPTGELRKVSGTVLDLRTGKILDELFSEPQLSATNGLDHNFARSGEQPAAVLEGPDGLTMTVLTDRPAIQIYTAGALPECNGKGGARYSAHQGVCLETQAFPDAVHHAGFPSAILRPGKIWHSETAYVFSGLGAAVRPRKGKIMRL